MGEPPAFVCGSHQSNRFTSASVAGSHPSEHSPAPLIGGHQNSRGTSALVVGPPEQSPMQAHGPLHIVHASCGSRRRGIRRTVMKLRRRERYHEDSKNGNPGATDADASSLNYFSFDNVFLPVLRSRNDSNLTISSASISESWDAFDLTTSGANCVTEAVTGNAYSPPRAARPPIQMAGSTMTSASAGVVRMPGGNNHQWARLQHLPRAPSDDKPSTTL